MVLLIPRRIKQLKEEGQRELQQQWLAWYERQQAAHREGAPFNEPPPAGPQSKSAE